MSGAPGHMRHPYDLQKCTSGIELKNIFLTLVNEIFESKCSTDVKIDGLNVSFKYTNGQFAVDRGSLKEIDISGVTVDRVIERFGEGHGMVKAITTLLTILNESLPDIKKEIGELGLIDNPHFFLNTEYVTPDLNVTSYEDSFIAIHGVNAFYEKWNIPTKKSLKENPSLKPKLVRSGLLGGKGTTEVPYSRKAMSSLIEKLNVHSIKYGFKVFGPIPASVKNNATKPSLDILDSEVLTIKHFGKTITKTINDWLESIDSSPASYNGKSYSKMIKTNEGKRINPYHRKSYNSIITGNDVSSIISDYNDGLLLISGVVFVHATRVLGNEIIKLMTSELGDLSDNNNSHEGIVVRESTLSDHPFKVTGDFIVDVLSGNIAKQVEEDSEHKVSEKEKAAYSMLPSFC